LREQYWSILLTTNLRLLLDECVTDPLAKALGVSSSALNIEYIRDNGMGSTEDADVIRYATRENRIVVTTETGINHRKFKICTHPGIIVLCGKHRHESIQAEIFQKFLLSGHRKEANHAVTFLSHNEARIKTGETAPDTIIRL
jgi:predicted nuclease of predicted toxin-antitoxin system